LITIIKPGILDTLQDGGRFGHAAIGINPNGAMDYYAMQVANALTGNAMENAVVEMYFPAPIMRFDEPLVIALAGADFGAHIGDTPVPINKPILVPAGATLSFKKKISGNVCYLSVHGGFEISPLLQSLSTHMIGGFGGLTGAKLKKGDTIQCKRPMPASVKELKVLPWRANTESAYMDAHYFYFIKGPEWDWMDALAQHTFLQEPFMVTAQSDRMAIRLKGEHLSLQEKKELVSSAVMMGTLQLLPDGQCLVLMADHQTTGGYPRVGNIIKAHLPKLAQASAGDYVHMLYVEQQIAEDLMFAQEDELKILKMACDAKIERFIRDL